MRVIVSQSQYHRHQPNCGAAGAVAQAKQHSMSRGRAADGGFEPCPDCFPGIDGEDHDPQTHHREHIHESVGGLLGHRW